MSTKNEMLLRLYVVVVAFALFAVLILARVIKISLLEGEKWRSKSGVNVKLKEVEGDRGNIYDLKGNLLATSLPYFDIRMDMMVPSKILFETKLDSLAYELSESFRSKTKEEWKAKLLKARVDKNSYFAIADNVTIDKLEEVKQMPILRKGRYKGGLIAERETKRGKPFYRLAARTIGIDRTEDKVGLEGSFDRFLKGASTSVLMKRLRGGVWVPAIDLSEMNVKRGNDIVTTLDMRMQDIVHEELERALLTNDARGGAAILMEVETGAIKAISNLEQTGAGYYDELYNHSIGTLSEPGSTFKLPTVLMLLEDSLMQLEDKIDLRGGKMKFYDRWMYDSDMHGKREVTLSEAFEMSSNVGLAKAANQAYGKRARWDVFADNLKGFGFFDKSGIELVGEPKPVIKHPSQSKSWWGTTVPWMAHGYELMQTPLQTLNFYNAIANGGSLYKPYLVAEIINEKGSVKKFTPKILKERIASKANVEKCQQLLKRVVEEGTGKRIKSNLVSFAGKTGTTRVNYAEKEEPKKYNASFVGYFPADKPKYSLLVMVYEPKKGFYGAQSAGPAFKNIVERVYSIRDEYEKEAAVAGKEVLHPRINNAGFSGDYEQVVEYIGMDVVKASKSRWVDIGSEEGVVHFDKRKIKTKMVPDVRGMGLRDATYVLENLGLEVKVDGVGKVLKQSIRPGVGIEGQKIEIYLN